MRRTWGGMGTAATRLLANLVEAGGQMALSDGQAHSVGDALFSAKRIVSSMKSHFGHDGAGETEQGKHRTLHLAHNKRTWPRGPVETSMPAVMWFSG
jgi:hypothetical protein